jgi:exodeoxyribonuclease V alpha subunit
MIEDRSDRRVAVAATGVLRAFNVADVLSAADVHVAERLGVLIGETDEQVLLAAALAVRAVRHGSVCVDLATVAQTPLEDVDVDQLPWPEPGAWVTAVGASDLVARQALRLEDSVLYLDRYWREEEQVCRDLLTRLGGVAPAVDEVLLAAALDRVFPADYVEQRAIAESAARRGTTVLTGGPGTGKTTTVARLLAIVAEQHQHLHGRAPRIALCAPTAKAAARLTEAVAEQTAVLDPADRDRLGDLAASTLHRLLGARWGSTRFRHDRDHRLPHDVVVVDETSMVSLTHMARLLEAVRPTARLVLVGDADQLASVEAGAVLSDVVEGLSGHPAAPVARLVTGHRFDGPIETLAAALRAADADAALEVLTSGHAEVQLLDPDDPAVVEQLTDDVVEHAVAVWRAADAGDAQGALRALDAHRLLCAHRDGPFGVRGWNARVERLLADRTSVTPYAEWYPGRPVLVTANNHTLGVYNGDIGITVRGQDDRLVVALGARTLAVTRLPDVDTLYAMTVHKAQGSQAGVVSVVMPPDESSLLTRELFYTAVTRAQRQVRVLGTEQSVRAAIVRDAQRASGLARRLAHGR